MFVVINGLSAASAATLLDLFLSTVEAWFFVASLIECLLDYSVYVCNFTLIRL